MPEPNRTDGEGRLDDWPQGDGADLHDARTFADPPQDSESRDSAPLTPTDLGLHDALHRYKLGGVVGKGGMSTILHATDLNLGRPMALKHLHGSATDPRTIRLVREARITAQLQHPGIVPIHELSRDADGTVFYTMSLIEGQSLGEILQAIAAGDARVTADFPLSHLLTIYQRACDAVAYAHSRGIVHRDLKPDNIMVGEYGTVLVIDWGVAKVLRNDDDASLTAAEPTPSEESKTQPHAAQTTVGDQALLTMAGALVGTPRYMAPEQATGDSDAIDERTDVYGLGGILYSILTLRAPILGDDPEDTLAKAIAASVPDPRSTDLRSALPHCPTGRVPEALAAVAMKALARRAEDRYQSVRDLQKDVEAYQSGFATAAEEAGLWKQVALFVKRNRTASLAAAAILLLLVGGSAVNLRERIRAERAEQEARAHLDVLVSKAPDLISAAVGFMAKQEFEEALERIDAAIAFVDDDAAYHNLRGNVLQTLLRLDEAEAAYERALGLAPSHEHARQSLEACGRLADARTPEGDFPLKELALLATEMRKQGRMVEARTTFRRLSGDATTLESAYEDILREAGVGGTSELSVNSNGLCRAKLEWVPTNLSFLRAIPVEDLAFANWSGADLSPLRGTPLRRLTLPYGNKVRDLSPLQGLPLEALSIHSDKRSSEAVSDISPLRGMPLKSLSVHCPRVTDLSPLRGMALTRLDISGTSVTDLGPLQGMPIESLTLTGCRNVTDLLPLRGMPLKALALGDTGNEPGSAPPVRDFSVLADLPLESLWVAENLHIRDLSGLARLPLRSLRLGGCRHITDLSPLTGHATLKHLSLYRTGVRDLSSLREINLQSIDIRTLYRDIRNLGVLSDMTNLTAILSTDLTSTLLHDAFVPLRHGDVAAAEQIADSVIGEWNAVRPMAPYLEVASQLVRVFDTVHDLREGVTSPPSRAREIGGHHYLLYPIPMRWMDAMDFCERHGGHLATLTSGAEDKAVLELWTGTVWLGFYAREVGNREKRWVTGEKWQHACLFQKAVWMLPERYGLAARNCDGNTWGGSSWLLADDDAMYPFIIEWDE